MQISTREGFLNVRNDDKNSFESWKANQEVQILSPKGFKIQLIESLILAQDERWRRA